LYIATAVLARLDTSHLPPALLELRNVFIHGCAFCILALLIRWSAGLTGRPLTPPETRLLLLLALGFGVGQEVLQTVIRQRAFPVNSLFDVCVDTTGAGLGLWLGSRLHPRFQKQTL
jgi:VanZ family protein